MNMKAEETVVFTNGCFDILHVGHVRYLKHAKRLGEKLIVGLNSDASVKRLKGDGRPVVSEADRREVLLALSSVDEVHIFEEDTPLKLILEIKPDVLVKGGDYEIDEIVGAKEVLSWGGQVTVVEFHEGHSSTKLIERSQ
jgi:D-beta-D-heptose 7-phosphate kinase/D-beta-D-heptose 1-phosphate adenosyltransferase